MGSGHAETCMTEDETSSSMYTTNLPLPKGVVRGCPRCDGCQKVLARWLPDGGHRPTLETARTFYPNEEEFTDTLKYIASIRPIAEPYGICRIVPPPSWKPPCPLRDKVKWHKTRFHTRVQQIHKLQMRKGMLTKVDGVRHKRRRLSRMTRDFRQEELYVTNFGAECLASKEDDFGFDPGPEITLEAFQKYATEFKNEYFRSQEVESNSDCIVLEGSKGRFAPSVENIEGEYWRVVEKPTEQIEVLYGADVETRSFGSGFPKEQVGAPKELSDPYLTSGWNLNNIARLPGSMLCFEGGDISGVVVPWVYIGMCFSSFCWHVEDHHFYSLNYLHWGAPKVWYGVPGCAAVKFENAMRKHLPHLFEEQPDLLQKLVTQLSPSILKCEGVPVYRCVQQAGEFVLTFPRAYHAGFNCGFNCAEAVNVAPVDWLPHGQIATELYQELFRKTSVSHDKLLLGASREAVKILWEFSMFGKYTSACAGWHGFCGQDGLLTKALKARVERESARRARFPNFPIARKMDSHFDMKDRECFACYYDLHLSAVGCVCRPETFACLEHENQLCSCDWSNKFFLYRYDVSELYILIEALGGKRSSINRWANQDLGLTSASYVNLFKTQEQLLQEFTSPLSSSNSIPLLRVSSLRGLPWVDESPNAQNRSVGKDLPRAKDSQSTTYIETIVLSDDEDAADINCREGKIKENRHELDSMRDFDNIDDCNERMAVDMPSAEKRFNKEIIEEKEQYMVNASFSNKEHSLNVAELTTDQDHLKQTELHQGKVSHILPNSSSCVDTDTIPKKSQSHIEPPFMQDVELQTQLPSETKFWSRDSFNSNLSDRAALGGRHFNCQKPPCTIASECIKTMEHIKAVPRRNHVENDNKIISGHIDPLDMHKDHSSAGVLHASASYDVRVLDVGIIEPCKPWYNSETIFPRGFKSCVTFYSILDPAEMCTYISEVLDAGLKEPVFKVAETRFASHTIVLRRLVKVKEALKHMVISAQWGIWKNSNTARAINVRRMILDEDWWGLVNYVLEITDPIMAMLRFADSDQPCLGDIYDSMDSMLEKIKMATQRRENDPEDTLYKKVEKIVHHRWNKMTTPLHLLAYALSPRYYSVEVLDLPGRVPPFRDAEVADGYKKALAKIFQDPKIGAIVRSEFAAFNSGEDFLPIAIADRSRMSAIKWWYLHGQAFMYLQPLAIKVLSQVTIAGHPTEVFMHISIQKCWELVVERLNKEITRQQSIRKKSILHLPPLERLNGLEMFGFTSPSVVHAIETLDHGHQCTDYWAARSNISHAECVGKDGTPVKNYKETNYGALKDSNISPNVDLPSEIETKDKLTQTEQARDEPKLVSLSSSENVYVVLEQLFKRARPNELWTLHKVLSGEACSPNWKAAFRALAEELKKL